MSGAPDELATRLHRRLLEAAASRPEEAGALTVGEVYHELIPYRGVRGELGVFELAAYEHALLRLLAGDVGAVRVVDAAARAEFAAELASPNPILGIYRDYASLEVTLDENGGASPSPAPPPTTPAPEATAPARETPHELPRVEPRAPEASDPSPGMPRPELPGDRAATPADATRVAIPSPPPRPATTEADAACIDCGRNLPAVAGLRFCPHCGADQSQTPCRRCSTPLRADWNFCIRCGAPRSTD